MLTSQQKEMLEKLPDLISKSICVLKNINYGYSDSHRLFNEVLIPKYLENESRYQKEFCVKTLLNHNVFQELRGNKKEMKPKTDLTLLKVAFGLGITYEEAFLLFCYNGRFLLTDDPYMGTINEILLELDNLPKRISGPERVEILDNLIDEKGLKLRVK